MRKFAPALLIAGALGLAAMLPRRPAMPARPVEADPSKTIVLTARGLLPWPDMTSWARH